ncbi:MAG TPA: hypothetical protein VGH58_04570 [Solirubrobacterales bacterium]
MVDQLVDRERCEGAILVEVGAEHRAGGPDAGLGERLLKPGWRQMDHGDRVACEWQRRAHRRERRRVVRNGEMTGLPARGGS